MSTVVHAEASPAQATARLDKLKAKLGEKPGQRWREAFGAMKGDPMLREAARLGAEWRAQENRRK